MSSRLARHPVRAFLVLTVAVSLTAGVAAFAIGGDRTFDDPRALLPLLVTIWSPNIAAALICAARGELPALLRPLRRASAPVVWLLGLLPLALAGSLAAALPGDVSRDLAVLAPLIALNLVMGPLGEELGWRGFLLPRLVPDLGLVGAALTVGVLWALWHLPLWLLPSPHRSVPFALFFAVVVCFSVIMTAIWRAGDRALGPVVLFHLAANVAVGWLEASEIIDAAGYRALVAPGERP